MRLVKLFSTAEILHTLLGEISLEELVQAVKAVSIDRWTDEQGLKCARFRDDSIITFNPVTHEVETWDQ